MPSQQEHAAQIERLGTLKPPYLQIQGFLSDIRSQSRVPLGGRDPGVAEGPSPNAAPKWPCPDDRAFATDENYNVISILGKRGSGKTTLLKVVTENLSIQAIDLVLDPIVPDRFGPSDTLLGWVLAGLGRWVRFVAENENPVAESGTPGLPVSETAASGPPKPSRISKLETQYRQVQRRVSRGQGEFAQSLASLQPDAFEYGEQRAELYADGLHLRREVHDLFDQLLASIDTVLGRPAEDQKHPLIILPIDDADLNANQVLPLLQELLLFVSHHRVVALLAGDEKTFRHATRASALGCVAGIGDFLLRRDSEDPRASLLDGPSESFAHFTETYADCLMVKYLPKHRRIVLDDLDPHQRLIFAPIESGQSLLQLFSQLPCGKRTRPALFTLADYFDFGRSLTGIANEATIVPSPYAEMLPRSPRDLVQLHRHLSHLRHHWDTERQNDTGQVLREFWTHILAAIDTADRDVAAKVVKWVPTPEGLHVELDYTEIVSGKSIGTSRALRFDDHTTIHTRLVRLFYAVPKGKSEAGTSSAFIAAILFTSEFGDGGFDIHAGQFSSLGTPGSENWNNVLTVEYQKQQTDDSYWLTPDWENYVDFMLYAHGWNQMVQLLRGLPASYSKNIEQGSSAMEYCFYYHFDLILHIQQDRRIAALPGDSKTLQAHIVNAEANRQENAWHRDFASLEARCMDLLRSKPEKGQSRRRADFVNWFSTVFPWTADERVASGKVQEQVLGLWTKGMQIVEAESAGARVKAMEPLRRRIGMNLDRPWTGTCVDLLEKMGADTNEISRLRGEWEQRVEQAPDKAMSDLQQLVQQLIEAGVPREELTKLVLGGPKPELLGTLSALLPQEVFRRLWGVANLAFPQQAKDVMLKDKREG